MRKIHWSRASGHFAFFFFLFQEMDTQFHSFVKQDDNRIHLRENNKKYIKKFETLQPHSGHLTLQGFKQLQMESLYRYLFGPV